MMDKNHLPPKFITNSMQTELFNRLYHRQEKNDIINDMVKRFNLHGKEAEELSEYANAVESRVIEYRVSHK